MAKRTLGQLTIACTVISQIFLGILYQPSLAETIFGNDYRQLTTVNPAGSNTSTSVSIAAGAAGVGTYVINPLTSAFSLQGAPSTTSLGGYGWRTPSVVGMNVPAGTWSFTVTTQSTVGTGMAHVVVFAYSTDLIGTDIQNIGSATGTANVIGLLSSQTETISFSTSAVDLTNRVLVVEYWLDVTTGPTLVAADVTFRVNSATEIIVIPTSPSTTYYLLTAQLHSIGLDDESLSISESISKHFMPPISDNLSTLESVSISASYPAAESMPISDAISIKVSKPLSEAATISDITSRDYLGGRSVSDLLTVQDNVGAGGIIQFATSEAMALQDQVTVVRTVAEIEDEDEESDSANNADSSRSRVQVVNPLKRTTVNELAILDDKGNTADPLSIKIDQRLIIKSTIKNEQSQLQPFVVIVQLTDSKGVTQGLEIATGVLDPDKTHVVEVSLTANIEGRFSGQIFCWSGLENGEPLSNITSLELFVS